jgi:hypothetical protein
MNYKALIILSGVIVIFATPAFAQNSTVLQGRAISETGEKTEFYTLVLQSVADSSVVAVEMFSDTVFRFAGIKPQTYILRLQDVQYQPYDTVIAVVEGTNVLKTPLVLKPATLGEVVVKGALPVLKYNHGNITVDVANSYLKDDVSLASILGKLPGLIVDYQGNVEMFGKKKLLIYINGMEMRSDDELRSLQPGNIDRIEIIRNVGSEYDASVDAVIRISTKKRREEKFNISLDESLKISYYLYNAPSLSLYLGGNEKISQYIMLNSGFGKSKDRHKSYTYTYFDDHTHSNFRNDDYVYKRGGVSSFYSLNYSISKDKELGVQYSGIFNDLSMQVNGIRFYDDETESQTVNLNSDEQNRTNTSTFNLNYRQKVGKAGELSVISDYMIKHSNTTTDIQESAIHWNANNIIDSDSDGKVFSIIPEYKITGKKFKYRGGLKYSYLNSKSLSGFRVSPELQQTFEHTTGAYTVFEADLSYVNIKSGIRAEYTNSGIRYYNELNDLYKNYFNLVPNISLNSEPNTHLNLSAYYRRNLQRPGIGSLNTTMRYWDSLMYRTGNPRLRPAKTDVFGFNAVFYKVDFLFEYRIYRDEITSYNIPDTENPNRTIGTYINLKETYRTLNFSLSYSFRRSVFSNMTSLNYSKQLNLNMPFGDEIIRFNEPIYYFQTSGSVKILKNTSLDYSFNYHSVGHSGTVRFNKPASNFRFTVSQYLMEKKLLISLLVTDIFNKYKRNRWTQYHNGNIIFTQDSDSLESRCAVFRIRYSWGKQKSIQQKRSDTDHINRL